MVCKQALLGLNMENSLQCVWILKIQLRWKKIPTTAKQEEEPGYWDGMQLLTQVGIWPGHSCLEWSGYLMTRNSQEHICWHPLSYPTLPCYQWNGCVTRSRLPATTRLHRGDLQWADPPNLLQLQQLVWPQPEVVCPLTQIGTLVTTGSFEVLKLSYYWYTSQKSPKTFFINKNVYCCCTQHLEWVSTSPQKTSLPPNVKYRRPKRRVCLYRLVLPDNKRTNNPKHLGGKNQHLRFLPPTPNLCH